MYVDGNIVRKFDIYDPLSYQRRRRKDVQYAEQTRKIERQKMAIRFACIGVVSVFLSGLFVWMLSASVKNMELKNSIKTLENQIEELAAQNDSKEYDMNSSVDLNYIVQVATEELGMVRSSAGQIQTYNSQTSEYVQQVSEIPTE